MGHDVHCGSAWSFLGTETIPMFFFSQNAFAINHIGQKPLYIFGNCIGNSKIGKNPYDLPTVCIKGQIKGLLHRTGHNPFFQTKSPKKDSG